MCDDNAKGLKQQIYNELVVIAERHDIKLATTLFICADILNDMQAQKRRDEYDARIFRANANG